MLDAKKVVYTGRNGLAKSAFENLNRLYFNFIELFEPTISNLQDFKKSFVFLPDDFVEYLFCFSRVNFMGIQILDGCQAGEYSSQNLPSYLKCFSLLRNQYLACFDLQKKDSKVYVVTKNDFMVVEEFDSFWSWFNSVVISSGEENLRAKNLVEDVEAKSDFENVKNSETNESLDYKSLFHSILKDYEDMGTMQYATSESRMIYSEFQDELPKEFMEFVQIYDGGDIGSIHLWKIDENDTESQRVNSLSEYNFAFASNTEGDVYFFDVTNNDIYVFISSDEEVVFLNDNFVDFLKDIAKD